MAAFDDSVNAVFEAIEDKIDALDLDIESYRQGPVLEIEFDDGSKIVVNSQSAMQEIWVAAKAGGFHFKNTGIRWVDTRSQQELFSMLSDLMSEHARHPIKF